MKAGKKLSPEPSRPTEARHGRNLERWDELLEEIEQMTQEEKKRIGELCDELQALAAKNKAGFMLLCLKHLNTEEAFAMGNSYGKDFLQALNDSCKAQSSEVGFVDLANINNSAAFTLGLLRAFSGTRVRMADDLEELYASSFGHA